MIIIKCKMCGGDITLNAEQTYGTCDCCGLTMTMPKVSDERKANLFNRANHFRRQNDFDKAVNAYENILNEDNTDAEAHFGLVLSRYGIEYVEDPSTHQYVPTCHRVQLDSIFLDSDYLAAMEYAPDGYSRSIYEEEAKKISEIQKNILAISNKEEPFDVFICYKETAQSGSRTKDSALAQDLYYQLETEGYKTFFSRITLEGKLGQQYEPYIFAALNSAKVMVVIGTSSENVNSVWVKNEWSRFLAMMKMDKSRLLIPCYLDMDPYDLPEELSMLQSQDMSKIGFVQDLVRGIKKVVDAVNNKYSNSVEGAAVSIAPGIESLMKRGYLFLEDKDWEQADEYFERVLDIEPEYAPAYVGKLLAKLTLCEEKLLAEQEFLLDDFPEFQKAVRFADAELKRKLEEYKIKIQTEFIEKNYREAQSKMNSNELKDIQEARAIFNTMLEYKDSSQFVKVCLEREVPLVRLKSYMIQHGKTFEKINKLNEQIALIKSDMDFQEKRQKTADSRRDRKEAHKIYLECQSSIEILEQKIAKIQPPDFKA